MIDPFTTHIGGVRVRWENPQFLIDWAGTPLLQRSRVESRKKEQKRVTFPDRPHASLLRTQQPATFPLWKVNGRAPGGFQSWSEIRQRIYILKRVARALKTLSWNGNAVAEVWIHTVTYGGYTYVSALFLRTPPYQAKPTLRTKMFTQSWMPYVPASYCWPDTKYVQDLFPHWTLGNPVFNVSIPSLLNQVLL